MKDIPYNYLKIALIGFLIVFIILSVIPRVDQDTDYIYPFFSWFLFNRVPEKERVDYAIFIKKAGERRFDPPALLQNIEGVRDTSHSMNSYNALAENIGTNARVDKNSKRVQQFRERLEARFKVKPVTYQIARMEYNPIQRFLNSEFISKEVIQTFTVE